MTSYTDTPVRYEEDGTVQWPAPRAQIDRAREIIIECAQAGKPTLIVPDKDADGLSSGVILRETLINLGLSPELITIYILQRGDELWGERERAEMKATNPAYVFVVDQGSFTGKPLIDGEHTALIMDHHFATDTQFPNGSEHVSACNSPPVATSSLLLHHICLPLVEDIGDKLTWLAIIGKNGDLGSSVKFAPPFPDVEPALKRSNLRASHLTKAASLLNSTRRTAKADVYTAWNALVSCNHPKDLQSNPRLLEASQEVNAETTRCSHTAPSFSADGMVAVVRISSTAQVHPIIATKWAGSLKSKKLHFVMCANDGYTQGQTRFSCRIARDARDRQPPVDIIASLKAYASQPDPASTDEPKNTLLERFDTKSFAGGHVQATGGILPNEDFEELMRIMQVGVKPVKAANTPEKLSSSSHRVRPVEQGQNSIVRYFQSKPVIPTTTESIRAHSTSPQPGRNAKRVKTEP